MPTDPIGQHTHADPATVTVGRIVHYYPADYDTPRGRIPSSLGPAGTPLAAIVTETDERRPGVVSLLVFTRIGAAPLVDVDYREAPTDGAWTWPHRVPALAEMAAASAVAVAT